MSIGKEIVEGVTSGVELSADILKRAELFSRREHLRDSLDED
jgi:hypothetical protein